MCVYVLLYTYLKYFIIRMWHSKQYVRNYIINVTLLGAFIGYKLRYLHHSMFSVGRIALYIICIDVYFSGIIKCTHNMFVSHKHTNTMELFIFPSNYA